MPAPVSASPENLWLIAGPTAVGKSEVALLLAERLGGEIITVDSMQVYRGMDIGTAKPSASERARVPHHLLDLLSIRDTFDVALFLKHARSAVAEVSARGATPVFCGGTGLYLKAYLEGLEESPDSDPRLRAELECTPVELLLLELQSKDPVTFERIDRQNPRRVIRAVEILRLTGAPVSRSRSEWKARERGSPPFAHVGLSREREDLNARIEARVDKMFAEGLVEETRALLEAGLGENRIAMQALGYHQVVEHLQGLRSLEETIRLIKNRTRKFSKRQMTWFRGQMNLRWVELRPDEKPQETVERILGTKR